MHNIIQGSLMMIFHWLARSRRRSRTWTLLLHLCVELTRSISRRQWSERPEWAGGFAASVAIWFCAGASLSVERTLASDAPGLSDVKPALNGSPGGDTPRPSGTKTPVNQSQSVKSSPSMQSSWTNWLPNSQTIKQPEMESKMGIFKNF